MPDFINKSYVILRQEIYVYFKKVCTFNAGFRLGSKGLDKNLAETGDLTFIFKRCSDGENKNWKQP